ncbi:MAG: hypothetical protein JXR70_01970 [Spirochaetales bacterium]|nr:hypothetical protein [Spirochaetales bacterium]
MTKRILFLICLFVTFFLFDCEEKINDTSDTVVVKENAIQLYESPGSGTSTATVKAFSLVSCLNPNSAVVKKNADGNETTWYKIKSQAGTGWTVAENILFRESPEQNAVMIRESQGLQEGSSFAGKVVSRAYLYDELTYLGFKYKEQRDKEHEMALFKNIAGDIGWSYEGGFAFDTKLGIAKQRINLYKSPTVVGESATDLTFKRMDFVIVSMETLQKQNWLKVIIPDPKKYTKYVYYIEDNFNGTEVLSFNQFDKECVSQLKPIMDLIKPDVVAVLAAYDSVDYLEALGAIKGIGSKEALFKEKEADMNRFIGRYQNQSIFYNEFKDFLEDLSLAKDILEKNDIGASDSKGADDKVIDAAVYESDGM